MHHFDGFLGYVFEKVQSFYELASSGQPVLSNLCYTASTLSEPLHSQHQLETCSVVLMFESVEQTVWCGHSDVISSIFTWYFVFQYLAKLNIGDFSLILSFGTLGI